MINKITTISFLFFAIIAMAQKGSLSPYSFYGTGENTFKGTAENRMMGGLSSYSDSIHLNLQNPAGYASLQLVNYSVGVSYIDTDLKSSEGNTQNTTSGIDYLAVGIPTKHFNFGFGIIPKSSVGYRLLIEDLTTEPNQSTQFEGSGGVNQVFFSVGKKVFKDFGVGFTANYNFGSLNHTSTLIIQDIELATILINDSSLRGFTYTLGLDYHKQLFSKWDLQANYQFSPKGTLNSSNSKQIVTRPRLTNSGGDELIVDLAASGLDKTTITIPTTHSLGFSFGEDKKWSAGAQYTFSISGGYENKLFTMSDVAFKSASQLSVGGFYIPKYNSFTNYFSRIVYRAGVRIEKTGLHIKNQSIDELGISFGLGLPLNGLSSANIGVEFGKRGTLSEGLVEENFVAIRLGLSLNDRWFIKRKYN